MTNTTERLAEKQVDRRDALEKCLAKLKPYHRDALTARRQTNFQKSKSDLGSWAKSHDDAPIRPLDVEKPVDQDRPLLSHGIDLCPPYGGTSFIGQNSFDS